VARAPHLADWTGEEVHAECAKAYGAYKRSRTEQYRTYFGANPKLKDPNHPYKARDLASALPEGWAVLADAIPKDPRHLHHRSGNSSQVVALGVLGMGRHRDPTLAWLDRALGPLPSVSGVQTPTSQFEYELASDVLDESPYRTNVDFFVNSPANLMCIECKWTEGGIGHCGCSAAAPLDSGCSEKVLERGAYWKTATEVFHLPERILGRPCHLSFTYQAVRNVAAAIALAQGDQQPVFGLIYDDENPFFTQEDLI
jgi:hypothetical protein